MASRLEEDDAQGQNKWADIDDDDEDWAPEAITWGDGTKVTIAAEQHNEEPLDGMPPPTDLSHLQVRQQQSALMRPEQQHSLPPPRQHGLPSGKGLVLKNSGSDRPSLVAKPPALPTPAKSPWAQLPPVESGAPPSWNSEAPYGNRIMKDHGARPKEIAADDFSRSGWRDSNGHAGRELYNSQSGRYEPVQDRRGSMSHASKQHALMQRQQMAGDYPAEPSSAFQTNRTSQEGSLGRRRGSSNVSGGSGTFFARGPKGPDGQMMASEHPGARRLSFAGSNEGMPPGGPPHGGMQHRQQPPGWAQRSPAAAFATPHLDPASEIAQPQGPPGVDEVEYQKKLMRERVELARKRRQEEEAREEAARKERIQKKLDALGPAPDKKKDELEQKPTQIQRREGLGSNEQQDASGRSPTAKQATPRRLSHGQSSKPTESWTGNGPRPDRFTSWASGPSPPQPSRNVWGSPNNDRGLGNGTFNPDLGRIPGSTGPDPAKAPSPITLPPAQQAQQPPQPLSRGHAPGPIGSRANDLASKWVSSVAESDKQLTAARLAEKANQEKQLAERGLSVDDVQPVIKDTWRPVHLSADGTRQTTGATDTKTHSTNAWKSAREEGHRTVHRPDATPGAGVIGAGGRAAASQQAPPGAGQPKTSRFFPSKEPRSDSGVSFDNIRASSPTPPPPTMEDHPAYDGNVQRPQVSLPKPQPIVKLPPAAAGAPPQGRPQAAWGARAQAGSNGRPNSYAAEAQRQADPSGNWQDRINNLLNGGRPSPPKVNSSLVDASSRAALESYVPENSATVSLPAAKVIRAAASAPLTPPKDVETKPMAEECFAEQEMGSLPQIRIPHKVPEAAWQPAAVPSKAFPRKFVVESTIIDPSAIMSEISGNGHIVRIQLPGMTSHKTVALPYSATRGARGGASRPSPRSRGSGPGARGGRRERDASASHGDSSPTSSRGGRGTYRGRGSENWNRRAVSQTQPSPTTA